MRHRRRQVVAGLLAEGEEGRRHLGADGFPGLKPGDRWCLCASRWVEAMEAGCAPRVVLESTHERTLAFVALPVLQAYAIPG